MADQDHQKLSPRSVVGDVEVTDWHTTLTDRDFPQLQGDMCPIREPAHWRSRFTWAASGRPHDLLVFGSPTDAAFSAYHSAGARFASHSTDQGYVLDFTPSGLVRLYRSDGIPQITQLGQLGVVRLPSLNADAGDAGDAAGSPLWTVDAPLQFEVEVSPDGIVLRCGNNERSVMVMNVEDATYRGEYLYVLRTMSADVDPRRFTTRADPAHSALDKSPFDDLVVWGWTELRRIIGGGNDAWGSGAALDAEDELFRRLGIEQPTAASMTPSQVQVADRAYEIALGAARAMLDDALAHGRTTADLALPDLPDDSVSDDEAVATVAVWALIDKMKKLNLRVDDMATYLKYDA